MSPRYRWLDAAGRWLLVSLAVCAFAGSAVAGPVGRELVDALRGGGHVIYFRHAATDWAQTDRHDTLSQVGSCDPQVMRQLSAPGRQTATRVGESMRRLGIPVGRVLASEFCRTAETAHLLDLGPVQLTRDVINANVAAQVGGRDALAATARARLVEPTVPGTNTVIVAHGNVFLLVAGTRPVEAGAAIVRGTGGEAFDVVAMLAPEDWFGLAARYGKVDGPVP